MKCCKKCGEEKPLSAFHKQRGGKDGLRSRCIVCLSSYACRQRELKSNERKRAHAEYMQNGVKQCKQCKVVKPFSEFYEHPTTKDRLAPTCKACRTEAYQADNERIRGRARITAPVYRSANKQKIKAWHADNYRRNRDIILPRTKAWAAKNKEQRAQTNIAWRKANPDKMCSYNHTRRAARIAAGGSHTAIEIRALLASQGHLCANPYCRADLRAVKKHLDHKMPFVLGGSNGIENLQWLCATCNLKKSKLDYNVWLAQLEMAAFQVPVQFGLDMLGAS